MSDREKLIEEAAKAIDSAQGWLDTHRHHHSARRSDVKALIRSLSDALSIFDKGTTPSVEEFWKQIADERLRQIDDRDEAKR